MGIIVANATQRLYQSHQLEKFATQRRSLTLSSQVKPAPSTNPCSEDI
jgi:hypothetical protein